MRKDEERFTSEKARETALAWGNSIKAARLQRNLTQLAAAERARMSQFTWLKLEKGDVSVSMGAWLSAMDVLDIRAQLVVPEASAPVPKPRMRARQSSVADSHYDF